MFKDALVEFEQVDNKIAVQEIFAALIEWAERNKSAVEIARKLRNVHELVAAVASFDMPP
jgi:hypothetical protein